MAKSEHVAGKLHYMRGKHSNQNTASDYNAKQQTPRGFLTALFINSVQLYFLGHDL